MDDADELEQCWLMLAVTYIQANKYDEALELCKKVLAVNKVCRDLHEDQLGFSWDMCSVRHVHWKFSEQ